MPGYQLPPWKGPLAPLATIRIIGSGGSSETIRALLDTGADYTEIPARIARTLALRRTGEKKVRKIENGRDVVYPTYWASVELDARIFDVLVIASDGLPIDSERWALVGRDILNEAVVLDGPRRNYDVARDRLS